MSNSEFDANDLLNPIFTCFISVLNEAAVIEQQYGNYLKPLNDGIYIAGQFDPVIIPGRRYFSSNSPDGWTNLTQITDFNSVDSAVYDEQGNTILSAYMMKNKAKLLFNQPTIPARGAKLIKAIVEHSIVSIRPKGRTINYATQSYHDKILRCFEDQFSDIVTEGWIEKACQGILGQVHNFIGTDVWNIYFVKFQGLDLKIEKCIDQRIYEWTINEYSKTPA